MKTFFKISPFNVCFQKFFFSPKTVTDEASHRDRSIPHPFLWVGPNVLPWGVRLCSLWEWGFALQLWSRQERNKPHLLQSVQANHSTGKCFCVNKCKPYSTPDKIVFFLNVKWCHNKMRNILTGIISRIITFLKY